MLGRLLSDRVAYTQADCWRVFFFFFIIIIIEPADDSRHSGSVWGFRLPIAVQHIWCEQTLFVSVTKVTRRNREGNLPRQQYKLTGVLIQSFPPSEIKKKVVLSIHTL